MQWHFYAIFVNIVKFAQKFDSQTHGIVSVSRNLNSSVLSSINSDMKRWSWSPFLKVTKFALATGFEPRKMILKLVSWKQICLPENNTFRPLITLSCHFHNFRTLSAPGSRMVHFSVTICMQPYEYLTLLWKEFYHIRSQTWWMTQHTCNSAI